MTASSCYFANRYPVSQPGLDDLVIRQVDLRDAPQVDGLFERHKGDLANEFELARRSLVVPAGMSSKSSLSWTAAAFCGQHLVGLALVTELPQSDRGEVRVIVDAGSCSTGIAAALTEAAAAWALTNRKSALRITCSRKDWPMRSLLDQSGAKLDMAFGEIVAHLPRAREPSN